MAADNNSEYYIARASAARKLAERAVDPNIKAIHLRMADEYDTLARSVVQQDRSRTAFD